MQPRIERLDPAAAVPGGDVWVRGEALFPDAHGHPGARIGEMAASTIVASTNAVLVRVPEGAQSAPLAITVPGTAAALTSNTVPLEVAVTIAEDLHPVCNPALDAEGNIHVTRSGSRGQKTPVSLLQLDANYTLKPWNAAIMNPSGLAFDREGWLYVSSRHDGTVYRLNRKGAESLYCEGLGAATGLALDADQNLYVGDRSGTIFKIDGKRKTFVFATLEPSVAAYHLAFGPDGYLYVSGPSTSSFDAIWRISPAGAVETFFRGLGRPQGIAFDRHGALYVVASYRGNRGVVRISRAREANLVVAGQGLVGLAFAPGPALILATTNALYHLNWNVSGLPLPPGEPPASASVA